MSSTNVTVIHATPQYNMVTKKPHRDTGKTFSIYGCSQKLVLACKKLLNLHRDRQIKKLKTQFLPTLFLKILRSF